MSDESKKPADGRPEAAILAEAQRTLEANRRAAGLDLDARSPVVSRPNFLPTPPPLRFGAGKCARCGVDVEHPGICADCGAKLAQVESHEASERAIRREIPKHFAWASWDSPDLARRVRGGAERVQAARAALESGAPIVILLGVGRSGKTSLAAAWMRAVLKSGNLGARWVAAWDLTRAETPEGGPLPMDRALTAKTLLLDDLGAELRGAPEGSGLLAQRVETVSRLVVTRHDNDLPMVLTTAIGTDSMFTDPASIRRAIADKYGDNVAGRLVEHAAIVPVGVGGAANDITPRASGGR